MTVARVEVDFKEMDRVKDRGVLFKDHCGSFEKTVCLVHWEEQQYMWVWHSVEFDGQMTDGFVVVSKAESVMVDKLTQPEEAMPANKYDSVE